MLGGWVKGAHLKAPTIPRVATPTCHSRCGMASRFGFYVSGTTFRKGNVSMFHVSAAAKTMLLMSNGPYPT